MALKKKDPKLVAINLILKESPDPEQNTAEARARRLRRYADRTRDAKLRDQAVACLAGDADALDQLDRMVRRANGQPEPEAAPTPTVQVPAIGHPPPPAPPVEIDDVDFEDLPPEAS